MGAENSVQRDGKSPEDGSVSASGGELSAEVTALQEGGSALESKVQPRFLVPVTVHISVRSRATPTERCCLLIQYICTFIGVAKPPGIYCTVQVSWSTCVLANNGRHLPLGVVIVSLSAHQPCAAA